MNPLCIADNRIREVIKNSGTSKNDQNSVFETVHYHKTNIYIYIKKQQTNKQKYCITFSMSQSPEKISLLGDREHHYQNLKLETLYHKALP